MQLPPQPARVSAADHVPPGLRHLMPLKGEAAMRRVANDNILYIDDEGRLPRNVRCHVIARYALHAAQDGGFGVICVMRRPDGHKHEFRVADMVKKIKKWTGPSLTGLTQMRDDCWFDTWRKIWVMGYAPNPNATVSMP